VDVKKAERQGVQTEQVQREAEMMSKMQHPHIVRYHGCLYKGMKKKPAEILLGDDGVGGGRHTLPLYWPISKCSGGHHVGAANG